MNCEVENMIDRVEEAMDVCRSMVLSESSVRQWTKSTGIRSQEIVTNLDYRIENYLIKTLSFQFPCADFIAEERGINHRLSLGNGLTFIIDPIDGTRQLASGESQFSISVGVVDNHRVIGGVVDFPRFGVRYSADIKRGAYLDGSPIRAHSRTERLRIAVSPSQSQTDEFRRRLSFFPSVDVIPIPSFTPKLKALLDNAADVAIYWGFDGSSVAIWDYVAMSFILEQGGGVVTDFLGTPLLEVMPFVHTQGWIASHSKQCHDDIMEVVEVLRWRRFNRPPS